MNTGRFLGAAVGVWVVRVVINYVFYEVVLSTQFQELQAAHPGIFREVIPAYIATDLLFALLFAFLFAKVGSALGGGVKAGVMLGVLVAVLSHTVGSLYQYYSFTFMAAGMVATDVVVQWVAHAIEGAVAGAIYKS